MFNIIYGKSGSGKSTSLRNFGANDIVLFNVEGKTLPFRTQFSVSCKTDSVDTIINWCKQAYEKGIKVAVIDDAGYMMTHHFMNNHRSKKGNASFEMYDDIADNIYNLVRRCKEELPEDMIVYAMFHEDTGDNGETKLRTIGKLLDNKVCVEGMVTICIRCMSDQGKHFFRTQTDGFDITKTPIEMFSEIEIDNDLKLVDTTIREFYGWNNTKSPKNKEEKKS